MKEYLQSYALLLRRLDDFFQRTKERYPKAVACTSGCADCCQRDLSLFPFETNILLEAVRALPQREVDRILQRAERAMADPEAPCPLLHEGLCQVYESRSVICRTHGLPCLVTTASKKRELSVCPYNFQGLNKLDGDCVLDLDPVNRALATINHLACSDLGTSAERLKVSVALVKGLKDGRTKAAGVS